MIDSLRQPSPSEMTPSSTSSAVRADVAEPVGERSTWPSAKIVTLRKCRGPSWDRDRRRDQRRRGDDSLELEISDDGAGGAAPVSSGGHGLVGMQERVALYGGSLDAGRRPGRGFAVRVLLPIP
jgi:hypothetical protein